MNMLPIPHTHTHTHTHTLTYCLHPHDRVNTLLVRMCGPSLRPCGRSSVCVAVALLQRSAITWSWTV